MCSPRRRAGAEGVEGDALLALGALPKLLDPMRRAKANREGCLCLGPIFDLAQVRSVDMYTEQRVSPAPNAERQHCEALVELIEEAIARRERKLHEEEPPLLPTTSALTSTTAVVGRLLTAVDADVALAAEEDDGADEELADMTELLDADEYLPGDTAAPAAPGGEESRVTLKVATDGGARQRPPTGLARALLSPFPFPATSRALNRPAPLAPARSARRLCFRAAGGE